MKESQFESKLVAYAKSIGVLSYKFSSPSQRGVPDRIFIGPSGVLFLELKVGSNKPTKLQLYHIAKINDAGGNAAWSNDWDEATAMVDKLL